MGSRNIFMTVSALTGVMKCDTMVDTDGLMDHATFIFMVEPGVTVHSDHKKNICN
jgi:hypothetical protein